jgi:signal recognition particle protein, putative
MQHLPPLENEIAGVDTGLLETSNWSLGTKYVKKTTKVDASPRVKAYQEKKSKKKKKKKLPKNYDPNVDPNPERWLPKWQRTGYKKKKDKRNVQSVGKGTQGAVSSNEQYVD